MSDFGSIPAILALHTSAKVRSITVVQYFRGQLFCLDLQVGIE